MGDYSKINLLNIISSINEQIITKKISTTEVFKIILQSVIDITKSEYGFIAEVLLDKKGNSFLKTFTITDINWNDETREFYQKHVEKGLEFHDLDTLFGSVVRNKKIVISNDIPSHPDSKGVSKGHPPIKSFLGIPLFYEEEMVGMVGIANREKGYNDELVDFIRPLINTCSSLIYSVLVKEKNKTLEQDYINQFESIKANLLELEIDFEGKILDLNHNFSDLINPMINNSNLHVGDIFISGKDIQGKKEYNLSEVLKIIKRGENYVGEFYCSKEKWIRGTFIPIKDKDGQFYKVSFLGRDFTSEKIAQTEKEGAVQMLDQILDQTINAVVTIDKNKIITYYNQAAVDLFGWKKNEVIGENVKMIVPEEHKEVHDQYVDDNMQTGINKVVGIGRDVEMVRKGGSRFWGHLALSKVIIQGEVSYTAFISDISVRKEHEQEKSKYIATIEKQNQELEQFAFIASHDLQEPLRTITSFLSIIEEEYGGKFDEDLTTYLGFINKSAVRMSALIRDLFDLSQIGRKNDFVKINLSSLIKEIKMDFFNEIKEKKAVIKCQNLPKINGIEKDIKLLLKNLISNAIKFSKNNEKLIVNISAEDMESYWQFQVEDNGIGINPRYFEKIFVIFQRLHTKDEYPGTGIGLAQCRKIAEDHGGEIWVDSVLGKGSSFYFTLKK